MAGKSRRWMILVATLWIQAFTGTNFDFSAYSSALKAAMGISQVQLNYLATASDLGKAIGWSSGLALIYFPLWAVLLLAAAFGFVAYGAQWLLITGRISLPYLPVFLLCLLAGSSICWFNTVCFVLCVRNFSTSRALALSLTISFNGVSAALYTLAGNALDGSSSTYLFLNAFLPLLATAVSILPILRQPPPSLLSLRLNVGPRDSPIFFVLNVLAFLTGLYLLLLNHASSLSTSTARLLLGGAILLLIMPLCVPGVICLRNWASRTIYSAPLFNQMSTAEDIDLQKQLLLENQQLLSDSIINEADGEAAAAIVAAATTTDAMSLSHMNSILMGSEAAVMDDSFVGDAGGTLGMGSQSSSSSCCCSWLRCCCWCWCCDRLMEKDRLMTLGEEHSARMLVSRMDFWLYYVAYFCGATVGLVYSNNLGQIAESLGKEAETTMLVAVYSACSFFGRLLSAVPDFLRGKVSFARTGWLAFAALPMPVAFFVLAETDNGKGLLVGTGLIGMSSGFIFAAAVSVTAELFGLNSIGVNHNILITNIPVGSLLYGLIAALIYDANSYSQDLMTSDGTTTTTTTTTRLASSLISSAVVSPYEGMVVCMGSQCYAQTFLAWGCITLIGFASSVALYLRTRLAYSQAERQRSMLEASFSGDSLF